MTVLLTLFAVFGRNHPVPAKPAPLSAVARRVAVVAIVLMSAAVVPVTLAQAEPAAQPKAALQFDTTDASKDLRARLIQTSATVETRKNPTAEVQVLLAAALADYRSFVQVLYDAGYFGPTVHIRFDGREAAAINPLQVPARVNKVNIQITPGRRFNLGTARVAPLPRQDRSVLPNGFETGAPASTGLLRDAAAEGVTAWRKDGHAKAAVIGQRITARHAAAELDADIRLSPGPRLNFGTLRINGTSGVRADAIRRIAGLPKGAQFHPDTIATASERLRRSGAFSSVVLREAEAISPDATLDIIANIEDLPKRRLTFGVELSSSDGVELNTSWTHRNLLGGAERLRFDARLRGIGGASDLDGRIGLRLDRPATLGPDDNLFYLAEVERLDEEHYTALRGIGTIGVRRIYSDQLTGEASVGFASVLATDAFGKRRFKYALARVRAEYDRRDSAVSATTGSFLALQAQPFLGLDGTASGVQVTGDGRYYRNLIANGRLVFAGRVQLGSTLGPAFSEVSPTLGFFSGGAGTVRGHEFQSLGVPVGTDTAGGRGFLGLSAELRGRLSDTISLVGFYDVGLIDRDSLISSNSSRHAGAGVGVRYDLAGIGPLRVDFAVPIDGDRTDGLQFYIGVGQAF